MVKNIANKKKKKGFTLIELIIVLAIMAILAAIAVPSFMSIRNSSKLKADDRSNETIRKSVMALLSDETISVPTSGTKDIEITFTADGPQFNYVNFDGNDKTTAVGTNAATGTPATGALAEVKKPQEVAKTQYKVVIKPDNTIDVKTLP